MDYSRMKYWKQGGGEKGKLRWSEYVREVKIINMYVEEYMW